MYELWKGGQRIESSPAEAVFPAKLGRVAKDKPSKGVRNALIRTSVFVLREHHVTQHRSESESKSPRGIDLWMLVYKRGRTT